MESLMALTIFVLSMSLIRCFFENKKKDVQISNLTSDNEFWQKECDFYARKCASMMRTIKGLKDE